MTKKTIPLSLALTQLVSTMASSALKFDHDLIFKIFFGFCKDCLATVWSFYVFIIGGMHLFLKAAGI